MRRLALAALFVIGATTASAQSGTISGTVTNVATRRGLDGVRITVEGTLIATLSRENGTFTLLGVPPGVYTVAARRIGFGERLFTNVLVRVDQTTRLSVELDATQTLQSVRVDAAPPLIDLRVVGTETSLSSEQILAMPALSISEVLSLSAGFNLLSPNAAVRSIAEDRRGEPAQVSVRGGRGGATVQLVDGISINNPVFGAPLFDLNPLALSSVTFSPGYMEAQYGGGVSGIVSAALREGGERYQGILDYQSTSIPGMLGSSPDFVSRTHVMRGVFSGPVWSTGKRLRFTLAGQVRTSRERVVEFTDADVQQGGCTGPRCIPVYRGWHGFGGNDDEQVLAKLTYSPTASLKLTATGIGQSRRIVAYDRRFLGSYRVLQTPPTSGPQIENPYSLLVQGSVKQNAHFASLRAEQRIGSAIVSASAGTIGSDRETCNVFRGVCLEDYFWRPAIRPDGIYLPSGQPGVPVTGTDVHFGGETFTTRFARGDFLWQATDHHRVQLGAHQTRHTLAYNEVIALEGALGPTETATNRYRAKPTEFAAYVQDAVEYDFLTVVVGLRYDRGTAHGVGFANSRLATNGTTAREVCDGNAPGINEVPFTYGSASGLNACRASPIGETGRSVLLDSAARLAQGDDFAEGRAHASLSPRLGLSFPLTEQSALFVNMGRYTKYPFYHDTYRNTGVGTRAGFGDGNDNLCAPNAAKPGTTECAPAVVFHRDQAEHIGNPDLRNEWASTFEVGYGAQIRNHFAVNVTAYSTEQGALTGVTASDPLYEDVGFTYGPESQPVYSTIVNGDYVLSRGVSLSLRRAIVDRWGFSVNYTLSRTTEVGRPPDLVAEGLPADEFARELRARENLRVERVSARDRTHAVNAVVFLAFRNDVPAFTGANALRNVRAALSYSWSSASRFTPSPDETGGGIGVPNPAVGVLNSTYGAPTNVIVTKDLAVGNVRYGMFLRVNNLLNSQACCGGLYTLEERRLIASGLPVSPPDQRTQMRRFFTGLTLAF